MAPFLIIASAVFATFLVVLALIAFAAFRFAAKREGPGLGAAGGCALTAVLLGAGLFALIGFAIMVGIVVLHRVSESGTFNGAHFSSSPDSHGERIEIELPFWMRRHDHAPAPEPSDDEDKALPTEPSGDIRQY